MGALRWAADACHALLPVPVAWRTFEDFLKLSHKRYVCLDAPVQGCAYAGSGNVLKVQQLLSTCSDHLDDKNAHQVCMRAAGCHSGARTLHGNAPTAA